MAKSFPTDIEIASQADMLHINKIAEKLHVDTEDIEQYGKYKAKLPLTLIDEDKVKKNHLILVTAINPTPAGEGKTTTSIGLVDGLNKIGKQATGVLREPSLGPVFGVKGGAAGGGYSQVVPMEDINLHFTGDFNAIEKANNLLSAMIDNNMQSRSKSIGLDARRIYWKRAIDMNDRALRDIVVGIGGTGNGMPRQDGFNITPASEIMAILCLSEDFADLKERLGNIYIGDKIDRSPAYAKELQATGAMAILLKDAIKPNLVQTLENNPVLIHGGPFASIAQGTNTVLATKMGLSLSDYVVTEAGFGADLGAEKFLNIKCQAAGLKPEAVVIVTTVRALRHHGGAAKDAYGSPDLDRVKEGFKNLAKHIENVRKYNIESVVSINHFPNDSDEEIEFIKTACADMGVKAVVSKGFADGGAGMTDLAEAVTDIVENGASDFTPLYDWSESVEDKIAKIANEIYGATGVEYSSKARTDLRKIKKLGLEELPVCMVKTPVSLSDDPKKIGRPENFDITVREFEIAAGAGFIIPILGDTLRMPGLPSTPAAVGMDIDNEGNITGLS